MLRERVVPATKAVGLSAGGVAALFVALTGGSHSMLLGLAGVFALAGSWLIAVSLYLD